jgi:hypothetical protein
VEQIHASLSKSKRLGFASLTVLLFCACSVNAQPAADEAVAADEKVLKDAKLPVDGAGLLDFFRKRTLTDADRGRVGSFIQQLGANAFGVREQAAKNLLAFGAPILPQLQEALSHPDAEVRHRIKECIESIQNSPAAGQAAAAARLLRARRPNHAVSVLLAYVPFANDDRVEEEVLTTLLALGVRDGAIDRALPAALKDKEAARRAAAALVVGRSGNPAEHAAVLSLLTDPEAKVRLRAAQGVIAGRNKNGVPVLVGLLLDAPLPLAEQAEDLLVCLAGSRAPAVALAADAAARKRCREAWDGWWKSNKATFDMQRAVVDVALLDASQRARDVARHFLNGLIRGDVAAMRKTTDVPFTFAGMQNCATRDELDKFLGEVAQIGRPQKASFNVVSVVSIDDYLKTAPPNEKEAFKEAKAGLRAVYVQAVTDGRKDTAAVFVRIAGSRVRVVGVGQGKPS